MIKNKLSPSDLLTALRVPERQVFLIPIDHIFPDPNQPRKSLQAVDGMVDRNSQEALEELAADIADQGLHHPITVSEFEPGDRYLIVIGERRWRAFKFNQARGIPGSDAIPAFIRQDLSSAKLRLAQLSENLHRSDLSDIEVANFIKDILEEFPDLKKQELAKLLKRNNSWISRILALIDPRWAHLIDSGVINYATVLEYYRTLPETKQIELYKKAKDENRALTVEDIRQVRGQIRSENKVSSDTHHEEYAQDKHFSDSENDKGLLNNDLAIAVQNLIDDYAPKGEVYTPSTKQSEPKRIIDFGGDAVIPAGPQSLNANLLGKREAKLTLSQLELLLRSGVLPNKNHVVSLMLPVDELREVIAGLGGEQPEDDGLLTLTLMKQINAR